MELKKALVLRMSYNDVQGEIRVDKNEYICLNDLAIYYPQKRIDHWKTNQSTIEFIELVDKKLNTRKTGCLESVVSKRGKYNGGTYAHHLVAMEFCMWLSPEFKLEVIEAFTEGTQRKENWNMNRKLAAENFKLMRESVEDAHENPKAYHYSNEARMLNMIVFKMNQKGIRDIASEQQLNDIAWLESKNSAYIDIDMSYDDRKDVLTDLYQKHNQKRIL